MDEKEKENSHYQTRARTTAVDDTAGPGRSGKGSGRCCERRWLGTALRATVAWGGAAGPGTTATAREGSMTVALAGSARGWRRRGEEHGDGAGVKIGLKFQEGGGECGN
jgi:hypothetical protein